METNLSESSLFTKHINQTIKKNSIIVYHGSIFKFNEIDVTKWKGYKDFGNCFYTTQVKLHAEKLAKRNKTEEFRWYNINSLSVKEFKFADIEWINFILDNRKSKECSHTFDIVLVPTADDDIRLVINAYFDGIYGEIGSKKALKRLLEETESQNLPNQIFFRTQESIKTLKLIKVERLWKDLTFLLIVKFLKFHNNILKILILVSRMQWNYCLHQRHIKL